VDIGGMLTNVQQYSKKSIYFKKIFIY
jgi:hypothetical protein